MLDQTRFSEDEHQIFRMGAEAALKFRADPYRDLAQDVFKAETAEYKLRVGYDDVTGETHVDVNFKHPCGPRHATLTFASPKEAIARALRFVAEHPAPRPVCHVDY